MKEARQEERVRPPAGDDESVREYGRQLAMDSLLEHALRRTGAARELVRPPERGAKGVWRLTLPLAAAAALVLCGYGLYLRQAATAPLTLVALAGEVAVTRAGVAVPVRQGLALQDGDQVAVKAGGTAALQYDREPTRIELLAATAVFRSVNGAKRVRLESGLLRCTAAPQRKPFLLETAHAVAQVVGTRFWLGMTGAQTTLAVQEGKVLLRQGARRLAVAAGSAAVADATALAELSPADAWTRELLLRAEAGSWEALRWGTGPCATGDWRMEMRGGPAERRFWNTPCDSPWSMVAFDDGTRCKRGVVVGRMMIPADGKAPPDAAVPPPGTNVHWRTYRFGLPNADAALPKARKASLVLNFGPPEQMRSKLVDILDADRHPHGVWHRFAVYFDSQTPAETIVAVAVWPEARPGLPPASAWNSETVRYPESNSRDPVGAQLGLAVNGVLMQTQGLKLVPLGPDLPPLPSELRREPRQ